MVKKIGAVPTGASTLALSRFERVARERGVIIRAMSRLYVEAPPRSALVMGFSGYPRRMIPPAVAQLAGAF